MSQETGTVVSGRSAANAAKFFNYGNIIAVLIPIPFVALWFGGSMLFYAFNRHHPNPKVGHYTQQAAYRFYALTGFPGRGRDFLSGGYPVLPGFLGSLGAGHRSLVDTRSSQDQS
jgi:hypothetical protein